MRELVIVVSDLYVSAQTARASGEPSAPGLARLARFGVARALPQGWRSWLAARLGFPRLADASPAAVSAAALDPAAFDACAAGWVWLADPVHLSAGMTSVHLTALLKLEAAEQERLEREFGELFAPAGYRLVATRSGRFLASGPVLSDRVETSDPARWLGLSLSDALARGRAADPLRRLGAEIEMWLHGHPLNARRIREGRRPVSTLWMWGGGAPLAARSASLSDALTPLQFFGDDPFMEGLSRLLGASSAPAPPSLAAVAPASVQTSVIQLQLHPAVASFDDVGGGGPTLACVAEILERDWIVPALEWLDRRALERLVLIAGDRQVTLERRNGWKRWRRRRPALEVLSGT